MRFKDEIWSSEDKKFHPGLISVSRSNDGRIRVAQVIYLDPETGDKSKKLAINKRTLGVLKGSHVELSTNKNTKELVLLQKE